MSTRLTPSDRRGLEYFAGCTLQPIIGDRVLCRCLFSAQGAGFNLSLGQRPRIGESPNASAEDANQHPHRVQICESRFQRSCMAVQSLHGALPQAKRETPPLALNIDSHSPDAPAGVCHKS